MNREATLAHIGVESGKIFLIHFRQWKCQNCQKKNFPSPISAMALPKLPQFFFLPLFRQCNFRNCHKIFFPFPYFGNAIVEIATNFFFPTSTMALPNFTCTHRLGKGSGSRNFGNHITEIHAFSLSRFFSLSLSPTFVEFRQLCCRNSLSLLTLLNKLE